MANLRLSKLLEHVVSVRDPSEAITVLGLGSVEVMKVDGTGVVAMSGDADRTPVFMSNDRAALLEQIQFGVGAGPCLDAFETRDLVEAEDLSTEQRWPGLASAVAGTGVGAIFSFPMKVGHAILGTIDFHRRVSGRLEQSRTVDGMEIASVMAELVMASTDHSGDGQWASGWEATGQVRRVVHQATGMISVQAGISVDQALARLRARAWVTGRTLDDLADDVVTRRLRFDP